MNERDSLAAATEVRRRVAAPASVFRSGGETFAMSREAVLRGVVQNDNLVEEGCCDDLAKYAKLAAPEIFGDVGVTRTALDPGGEVEYTFEVVQWDLFYGSYTAADVRLDIRFRPAFSGTVTDELGEDHSDWTDGEWHTMNEVAGGGGGGGGYTCSTDGNGLFYWQGPMPACESNPGGSWLGVATHKDGTYSFVAVGGTRNGESIGCGPSPDYVDPGCTSGSGTLSALTVAVTPDDAASAEAGDYAIELRAYHLLLKQECDIDIYSPTTREQFFTAWSRDTLDRGPAEPSPSTVAPATPVVSPSHRIERQR